MKKKITAVALVVALLAVGIIGGTLAYFTDTDDATNTFTMGKVDIELNETFDANNAKLIPGNANAVKKEVSIKLASGSEDAWVWYEYFIPAALDSTDGSTGTNNIVHVNAPGNTWDTYRENSKYWAAGQTEAYALDHTWDHDPEVELGLEKGPQGYFEAETIDGIEYHRYVILYRGKLSNAEGGQTETTLGMSQVYLDAGVDTDATGYVDKNGQHIDFDFSNGLNIIVRAYAIQADGFDDVYAAYKAYNA